MGLTELTQEPFPSYYSFSIYLFYYGFPISCDIIRLTMGSHLTRLYSCLWKWWIMVCDGLSIWLIWLNQRVFLTELLRELILQYLAFHYRFIYVMWWIIVHNSRSNFVNSIETGESKGEKMRFKVKRVTEWPWPLLRSVLLPRSFVLCFIWFGSFFFFFFFLERWRRPAQVMPPDVRRNAPWRRLRLLSVLFIRYEPCASFGGGVELRARENCRRFESFEPAVRKKKYKKKQKETKRNQRLTKTKTNGLNRKRVVTWTGLFFHFGRFIPFRTKKKYDSRRFFFLFGFIRFETEEILSGFKFELVWFNITVLKSILSVLISFITS